MQVKDAGCRDNLYGLANAATDKEGRFELDSLPEGFVYADVYRGDYDPLNSERLKVDTKDCILVLRKSVPGRSAGQWLRMPTGSLFPTSTSVSTFRGRVGAGFRPRSWALRAGGRLPGRRWEVLY